LQAFFVPKNIEMEKVNIAEKLSLFSDYWNPRIVGELNGQQVKLVKFKGEFIWHHHEHEDEMFYVVDGEFTMELRDKNIHLTSNEFFIVPRGVEHRPVAKNEVSIMLFEPKETLNTGNKKSELTQENLKHI
jgi:mannose-6-phosphate isomerase-like protein (cupin superfamily)